MTFYMIFCAKLDFQISNPAVIPSEEPALEASTALLERKNFEGWTKMSKIEKMRKFGRFTVRKSKNDILHNIFELN